jgi:TonB-linked SusC/RagA family outer membrane protein
MGKIYMFLFFLLSWCSMASAHEDSGRETWSDIHSEDEYNESGTENTADDQQGKHITGKVTEADGSALPGVNVIIEGTNLGTVTDADGNYSIDAPSSESVLVFSFIGYTTHKATIGALSVVDVSLEADATKLGEVVVVGYTTQKRATLTGAVAVIDNQDIVRTKNENVLNSLTGKLPGVRIVQKSSAPGAYDSQIDIRGMGNPLFVVDGIVRDKDFFARLTSEEIESVSILKDGSAAIYGLGAANGVVLVTTKKGTSHSDGKIDITLNSSYSIQQFLYVPRSVGATDYMTLVNEKNAQDFGKNYPVKANPIFTDAAFAPYSDGSKKSYNWFDQVFNKRTPQSETNLSVNGGGEKLRYYFNIGYSKQMGAYKSGDYYSSRWNMRTNIQAQITKRLKAEIGLGAITVNTHQPNGTGWTTYKLTWLSRPDASFYANDNPAYPNGDSNFLNEGANMIVQTDADYVGYNINNDRRFNGTITLQYDIPGIEGLSAKGVYDYSPNLPDYTSYKRAYTLYRYNSDDATYSPISRNAPSDISKGIGISYSTNMQLGLNYSHTFFNNHNVNSFVIFQETYNAWDGFSAYRQVLINSEFLFAGEKNTNLSNDQVKPGDAATHSLLGQLNYDFKGKYLLDFRFRYDGSSSFPQDHRFGFFPSISVGWRLSEESFIQDNLDMVSNLKLRGSYGVMGDNAAAETYPPSPGYNLDPNNFGWYYGGALTGGVSASAVTNPNLTWYTAKAYNAGIDFGVFNQRITGTFDIYKRDLTGILANRSATIPGTVGATLPQENLNSTRNYGYEISLRYNNNFRDITYYIGGQLSATKSKRTKWLETPAGNSYDQWKNRTSGRNDNIWWGNESKTQFTSYEQIQNSNIPVGQNTLPGDWVLNDWNGDGVINGDDDHPIATQGRAVFNYGISLGAAWKGFDLAVDFQGAYGVYVRYSEVLTEALPFGGQNTLSYFTDRWHPEDPNADYYNPNTKWVSGYYPVTGRDGRSTGTNGVQNASYMRMKTAQLGYTLPKKWISKINMQSVRFYVSGYNLLTFTGLKNVDPERPSSGGTGAASVEFYNYPVNKTYTFGATVKF